MKDTQPVFCKAGPVPIRMKEKVLNELDRLENLGILTKVISSNWVMRAQVRILSLQCQLLYISISVILYAHTCHQWEALFTTVGVYDIAHTLTHRNRGN